MRPDLLNKKEEIRMQYAAVKQYCWESTVQQQSCIILAIDKLTGIGTSTDMFMAHKNKFHSQFLYVSAPP